MYIIDMKKLSLFLALALVLASSAFAERKITLRNGETVDLDKAERIEKKDVDCSKLEWKENGDLYIDGKPNEGGIGILGFCDITKIKGYDKARRRLEQRDRENQEKNQKHNKK